MDKEQETVSSQEQGVEAVEGEEEVGKEQVESNEVETYIEEVEKAGQQPGSLPMDDQGQPLVKQMALPQDDWQLPDDAVVLPMTQKEFEAGIHAPLVKAVRWLAEWCSYMIKKFGEKVFFKG